MYALIGFLTVMKSVTSCLSVPPAFLEECHSEPSSETFALAFSNPKDKQEAVNQPKKHKHLVSFCCHGGAELTFFPILTNLSVVMRPHSFLLKIHRSEILKNKRL